MSNQKNPTQERGLKKLPDGRWLASWKCLGRHYRRICPNKAVAQKLLLTARSTIATGTFIDPVAAVKARAEAARKAPTFEQAVELFLKHGRATLRPGSIRNDERMAKHWLESPIFSKRRLSEITPSDIHAYRQTRQDANSRHGNRPHDQKVTPRHADHDLGRLKRLFNLMVEMELMDRNPAARVKFLRQDNKRVRYLSSDEERRLLASATPAIRPAILFTANTGLRRGELLGLCWKHVDMAARVLTVPVELSKSKRIRHVPLNDTAVGVLRVLPRSIDGEGLVFTSGSGGPIINLSRYWYKAVKRAGLVDFRWHDIRHHFASKLAMKGVPLNDIREILGHTSYEMVLRYAHLSPEHLLESVRRIG